MDRAKNMQNNANAGRLKELEWSYYGLKGKYNQLQEKYNKLLLEKKKENKIRNFLKNTNSNDPLNVLRRDIVFNIIENDPKEINGHRHNDNIYDFSRMMQNCNLKSYEILRQIIYLPSVSCLDTHFTYDNNLLQDSIQNIESIHNLLFNYIRIFDITEPLTCILSIDAASLDRPNKISNTYVFTFYLQPLNQKYKCLPIHVLSKPNGKADEDIISVTKELIKSLQNEKIIITAVATDGDDGYNKMADDTFSKYIDEFEQKGFETAVEKIENLNEILWLSDMLHILKLARKYIIKGNITVKNTLEKTFNSESLEKELQLGLSLTDSSSFSYMQDFYPLHIFDLKNLMKLYEKEMFDEFLYFLPFSIWIEAITSPHLKKSARLHFLKTAFLIFYYYFCQHKYFKFQEGITVYITKKSKGQFLNNNFVKRCMNTLIITYSIIKNCDDVALNRIGSHPLENFFGLIRGFCHNFDSFENFIRCSIKAHENLVLRNRFNIKQIVKKRINVAGEKIEKNSGILEFNENICSSINVFLCALLNSQINAYIFINHKNSYESFQKFTDFIYEIIIEKEGANKKIKRPKITSGSHIKSRCTNAFLETKFMNDE